MAFIWKLILVTFAASVCLANQAKQQVGQQQRQAGGIGALTQSGILSTLGSMVPGVVSNMLPLVLLFGLGALVVPALGLGLLRETRRSFPSLNINTSAIMDGVSNVFEQVMNAIDNVDKKYE